MSRVVRITLLSGLALLLVFVALGYLVWHGYFDRGTFEIKQVQWSSSKEAAILAERWDDQALGGLDYFVVIGDHRFTRTELKHKYHSDEVVFAAEAECLTLSWDGPDKLSISCDGAYLDQAHINVEKQRFGKVSVSYVNISPDTAQTFEPK